MRICARGMCLILMLICPGPGFAPYAVADDSGSVPSESADYRMAEFNQNYFVNTIGMKFKRLNPGLFIMGAAEGDTDETPVHLVSISRSFYIGIYEVTQMQWKKVMGGNPSEFEDELRPVENVSWNEVRKFIKILSEKEGIQYRLPTEAEWEYACRAGSKTRYFWGDEFNEAYAWYVENSGGETHPVGLKKPNAWGLYDMSGNVYEWCADAYGAYSDEHAADPVKSDGSRRIGRGGGWNSSAESCRSSNRGSIHPYRRFEMLGFRLVRPE